MRPAELVREIEARGVKLSGWIEPDGRKRLRVNDREKVRDLEEYLKRDGEYRNQAFWYWQAVRCARIFDEGAKIGTVDTVEVIGPAYCVGHPEVEAYFRLHSGEYLCRECWHHYHASRLANDEAALLQGELFPELGVKRVWRDE